MDDAEGMDVAAGLDVAAGFAAGLYFTRVWIMRVLKMHRAKPGIPASY